MLTDITWVGGLGSRCLVPGTPLKNLQAVKLEECLKSCQGLNCTHINWSPANNGSCFLMNGSATPGDAFVTPNVDDICVIVDRRTVAWEEGDVAKACTFRGNNVQNVSSSDAGECKSLCERHNHCNHFSWSAGRCRLKSGRIPPEDAIVLDDESIWCGFIRSKLF